METPSQAKLFAKIAVVMGQVRTLERTGRNQFDKYDYVTADAIATRIGSALAQNGVAFLPSIVGVESSEYTTQKGASNFRTVVHMQMTFACTETGATYTSLWSGEAIDRSDKSISKAAVSAVKYFLLKTFLLAGGDEEEADATSNTVEGSRKASGKSQVGVSKMEPPADEPDDDLWESNQPASTSKKPDLLSQAQLTRLNILGADLYGKAWDEQRPKLVEAVSKGAVKSSKELAPAEAEVLIKGMERRLKEKQAARDQEAVPNDKVPA